MASHRRLSGLDRASDEDAISRLLEWPLNPTQHLWHALTVKLGFPFLKTELVLRNPGRLPDVDSWPGVVATGAPCGVEMLRAHLASMWQPGHAG
jgi:hypothetical protein